MNKKMKKIMSVVLTFVLLMSMGATVFAVPTIKNPSNSTIDNVAGNALGWVRWFGYAIAVAMLLYIGIKYMMASANEKADLKKGSINYVIGAVLVAAASTLVGAFVDIGAKIGS